MRFVSSEARICAVMLGVNIHSLHSHGSLQMELTRRRVSFTIGRTGEVRFSRYLCDVPQPYWPYNFIPSSNRLISTNYHNSAVSIRDWPTCAFLANHHTFSLSKDHSLCCGLVKWAPKYPEISGFWRSWRRGRRVLGLVS